MWILLKVTQPVMSQNVEGNVNVDTAQKMYIPYHFDELDAESETLSEKLRQIDAYQENEQGGTQVDEDRSNQQVWYMKVDPSENAVNQVVNLEI
jgi:hypothetical protein